MGRWIVNPQLLLFDLGVPRLEDVSIETRLNAAAQLLESDPDLTVDDRRRLLLLVVAPQVFAEAQR
jgi:hypothetical protein